MSDRIALHTFVATFVATLVLNGCSRPAQPAEAPAAPAAPAEPAAPSLGTWTNLKGEDGVGVLLTDATGNGIMQVACLRERPRMVVRVSTFQVIESEERLSFGVDGEPTVFVANVLNPNVGVEAALLDRVAKAKTFAVSYGAGSLGPMAAPTSAQLAEFVAGCREIGGL